MSYPDGWIIWRRVQVLTFPWLRVGFSLGSNIRRGNPYGLYVLFIFLLDLPVH